MARYQQVRTEVVRKRFEQACKDLRQRCIPTIVKELRLMVRLIERTILEIEEGQEGEELPDLPKDHPDRKRRRKKRRPPDFGPDFG